MERETQSHAGEIAVALQAAMAELGWPKARVADRAGLSQRTVEKTLAGESQPSGPALLRIMRTVPGFARRLDFEPQTTIAS